MIEIRRFTKRYEGKAAVLDLSLKIEKGEIFGFVDPNGAGKTTTIRFLATLLKPTSGEARIAGPIRAYVSGVGGDPYRRCHPP